jgi:hypothetical protein
MPKGKTGGEKCPMGLSSCGFAFAGFHAFAITMLAVAFFFICAATPRAEEDKKIFLAVTTR